jgi:hypothetical protein
MKVLDLFSGIGMYALGAEQAGHEVIGFCEKDVWARKILKKHWPMKPISSCIKSLNEALIASLGDSHVKILVTQPLLTQPPPVSSESVRDGSGRLLTPFAWWEQSSSSWRTWQLCFSETGQKTWAEFSDAWPPSGMMRNGIAWAREPLASPTIAPAHTFLPTLGASDGAGSSRSRYKGSQNRMRGRMSDGLRMSQSDPPCTHPNFAEAMFGLPKDYTELEMETHHVLSEK